MDECVFCLAELFLGRKYDNLFFLCTYVETACCIERKTVFVDVTILNPSKTLRFLDMSPSPLSSSVLLFKLLLLIEFIWLRVVTQNILLHRQTFSVQQIPSSSRPGSRLSCFLCLVQQVGGGEELTEIFLVQSPCRREFHSFFIAGPIQSHKSCSKNAGWSECVSIPSSLNFVTSPYLSMKFFYRSSILSFSCYWIQNPTFIGSLCSISDLTNSIS